LVGYLRERGIREVRKSSGEKEALRAVLSSGERGGFEVVFWRVLEVGKREEL